MKKLITMMIALTLLVTAASANVDESTVAHSDMYVTDDGWSGSTRTSDCSPDYYGWCDDRWFLTLTEAKDVTISVADCCCVGDFYEVYVDDVLIGTTPQPTAWGCSQSGTLSSGAFTVSLTPGTYKITVRDAGFDGHTGTEIVAEGMCPAGFSVAWTLGQYTGATVPEFASAGMVVAILLTTPGFAYLLIRKRK